VQLSKFFAAIDPVRDMLNVTLDGWEPPQIVTVGGQSSGKSSLLERLTMLPGTALQALSHCASLWL
jgi:hypothetical protein